MWCGYGVGVQRGMVGCVEASCASSRWGTVVGVLGRGLAGAREGTGGTGEGASGSAASWRVWKWSDPARAVVGRAGVAGTRSARQVFDAWPASRAPAILGQGEGQRAAACWGGLAWLPGERRTVVEARGPGRARGDVGEREREWRQGHRSSGPPASMITATTRLAPVLVRGAGQVSGVERSRGVQGIEE